MSNTEEAIDRAERQRLKELEQLQRDAEILAARSTPEVARDYERAGTAWNLRRGFHNFMLVMALVGTWFGIGLVWIRELRVPALFSLGIGLIASAILLSSFLRVRSWRRKLPFRIVGWNTLVDKKFFWLAEWWWPLAITVNGRPAVLAQLCARLNATFYDADDPLRDARIRWTVDGSTAVGSAGRLAAWAFIRWCEEVARERTAPTIEDISIVQSGEAVSIAYPSTD
jgi:hypothetical protein